MRKRIILILSLLLVTPALAGTGPQFDRFFLDKTMRMDYYHTGITGHEIISLDEIFEQPGWAGSRTNLIDTLNLGKYLLRVFDTDTNQLIYSRGYCSIFGEWQTTDEAAKGIWRTFSESALFPYPKDPVQVTIAARDEQNYFKEVFSTVIDPDSRFVNRETRAPGVKVWEIFINGPPAKKVDIVIIGEGYTKKEMKKLRKDAKHFTEVLFGVSPFKERKKDFNVRAIGVASAESGIDQPRQGTFRNTALSASFNSLDTPRYLLTRTNKDVRDIASAAPYDQIYILVNVNRYGGGGIFNLYSTCITGYNPDKKEEEWWPDYVFVHEFGHAFAGLADEYYTSNVSYSDFYPPGVEPWEPNITALLDAENVKWKGFIDKGIPIPTPWGKASYDTLKKEQLREKREHLVNAEYAGKVGAFEGGGYASKGIFRPSVDCRMFSKSMVDFCPVCRAAINRMIDFYSR